ncbi:HAD hydrolase family protein [Candidatus Ozemobacteraceae bacterium]|nr:HAD hydrolase family protein [Candidatus Ozemobacteraceae bacterium]
MMNTTDFQRACARIKLLLFDCDGVLTDGRIALGNGHDEFKFFSTKDGMGLALWRKIGNLCGVVTGRSSEALIRRAGELKFDELHQGVAGKAAVIEEIIARRGLKPEEVAFIGDDFNDLPAKRRTGLFFAPADAHPIVRLHADFVLSSDGGKGAVREAVDLMLTHQGRLEALVDEYLA